VDYNQTRNDVENTFGTFPGFFTAFPQDVLVKMWPTMKTYYSGFTRVPPKYRELIGLAVASALGCASCETFHRAAARIHGASDEELAEIQTIVKQVSFWHSVMQGVNQDAARYMKDFQAMAEYFARQEKGSKA
jgi:AhpD family alkylhydroperoxidase